MQPATNARVFGGALQRRALGALLTLITSAWANAASAQEVRVVGRLDARVRLEPTPTGAAIVGVLIDETGVPVAGTITIVHPEGPWQSCLGGAAGPTTRFDTDSSGRFCSSGPALSADVRPILRLTAEGHRDGEFEFGASSVSAEPPQLVSAPDVIELHDPTPLEVRASAASTGPSTLELGLTCSGHRSPLGSAPLRDGAALFVIDPNLLPGPGQCAFALDLDTRSATRPVTLRAPVALTALGWSTRDGRVMARVQATLKWRDHERPMTEGLLEVRDRDEHIQSAALDRAGIGVLEFGYAPTNRMTVRLIELPAYARTPEPLELEPPSPWTFWHAVEAALLVLLGVWLASSWRSSDRKTMRPSHDSAPALRRPRPSAIVGKVLDAHTGAPIGAAQVAVLTVGMSAKELVGSTVADAAGAFTIEPPEGALTRLRVSADGYLSFEGHLSSREPTIRLSTRRRAALGLLAAWVRGQEWLSKVRGMPALPTPGQVSRAAKTAGKASVAEWAEGVSRAAYGATPPSDADLSALAERKPS